MPPGRAFDLIRPREYLPLGVRVTRFAVDAEVDGAWTMLAEHEGIGPQRIIRLDRPIAARRVRLRIVEAPACPAISEFALFRQVAPAPVAPVRSSAAALMPRGDWRIAAASAPSAAALLDDDAATGWTSTAPPAITIDMGRTHDLGGFSLTPSRGGHAGVAPPHGYRCETSLDGTAWATAAEGEFPNIAYALATQRITFAHSIRARRLRFTFDRPAVAADRIAIAGIGAFAGRP